MCDVNENKVHSSRIFWLAIFNINLFTKVAKGQRRARFSNNRCKSASLATTHSIGFCRVGRAHLGHVILVYKEHPDFKLLPFCVCCVVFFFGKKFVGKKPETFKWRSTTQLTTIFWFVVLENKRWRKFSLSKSVLVSKTPPSS